MRANSTLHHLLMAGAATLIMPSSAMAQEAESKTIDTVDADGATDPGDTVLSDDSPATAGARVFTLEDLAQYAPQTALDMVNRIPGFSLDGGNNQGNRGLGQASQNVLINGQRVSGKSNDAFDALRRIEASKVVRIEIVDGAALDVPGLSGEVANVIYNETGGISGTWGWFVQFRPRLEDTWLNGNLNLSGGNDSEKWSLSFASNSRRNGHWGPEFVRDPDGNILITRDEFGTYNGDSPRLAGSYSRTATNGNELNLSAAGQLNTPRNTITGDVTEADGTTYQELFLGGEDEWNAEVGVDYAFDAAGGRLKLIGLQRNEHSPTYNEFGIVGGDFSRFEQTVDENESILRSEFGWRAGTTDWEVSLEGAYNSLAATSLFILRPFDAAETVTELPANDISELRSEAILSMSRPLADDITLQLNGGAEYSRIEAGAAEARSYFRPKGSLALSWRASEDLTLDAKVERVVDQLNFFQFLAAVDVQDDFDRARNNDIVPPQRWRGRLEAVTSLGEFGSLTPYVQYQRIEDVIEAIPVSDIEEALGNAGDADDWIVGIDGTLLLDPIGIPGFRFDIHAHVGDSSFTDPLLLTTRRLNGQELSHYRFSFRHDIPGTDIAYGGSINEFDFNGVFRLDGFSRGFNTEPQTDLFVEHKDVFGLQVRAAIVNLLGTTDSFERIAYVDRRDGPVAFTERRDRGYGQLFMLNFSGQI